MTKPRTGRTLAALAGLAFLTTTACGGGRASTAATVTNTPRPTEAQVTIAPAPAPATANASNASNGQAVTADDLKQTDNVLGAIDSELAGADAGLTTDEGDLTK